ncbi:MAG: hypothetical protein HY964_06785 [Ignavibacteriales bacterium]|nr:hypothetical protein [Ignavibacteriales bacterium]
MLFKSFSINRVLVLLVAGGFLFLFIDTLLEHQDVLPNERPAFIPIIVSIIGFIIALLAVQSWKDGLIRLLHFYLMLTMLVGFGGIFFHNKERFERGEEKTELVEEEEKSDEASPPVLAPAAFIGIAAIGLLGTARKRESEIRRKKSNE